MRAGIVEATGQRRVDHVEGGAGRGWRRTGAGQEWAYATAGDAPDRAHAGQGRVGAIPDGPPELRAEVGRLPLHHLPRRRRGGDRQPQREADDPLLPRARRGAEGEPAAERCVVDGEIILVGGSGDRLDFDALQQRIHPAASRVKMLAEQTPAQFVAFDLLALGDEDFTAGPSRSAGRRWNRRSPTAQRPIHLTAATPDPETGRAVVPASSRAPGWTAIMAKPLDGAVPAGQARDVQDQARTHRRLCRRRLPRAQERARPRSARCCWACTTTTASSPAWA